MQIFPNLQQKDQNIAAFFAWILKVTQYRVRDVQDYNQNTGLLNKFITALGINTSSSAVAASISFVSTTAKQVNVQSDSILYINCTTSTSLTLAIGPTSSVGAVTLLTAATVSVGLFSVRIPAGWFVKLTGTMADFTCNYVTC